MNEIRFSSPSVPNPQSSGRDFSQREAQEKKEGGSKKIFKYFVFLVLIAAIGAGVFLMKDSIFNRTEAREEGASAYSAVFLSNGQVYFGKILRKDDAEIVLSSVYYLKISENNVQQEQTSEPKFSLVRLVSEVHGPTDMLYVNDSQVLFYENLREDSQVVQSIHSMNPKN